MMMLLLLLLLLGRCERSRSNFALGLQSPDLQNISRQSYDYLSYDNAKVTIDLRRTSNLQNILRRMGSFS